MIFDRELSVLPSKNFIRLTIFRPVSLFNTVHPSRLCALPLCNFPSAIHLSRIRDFAPFSLPRAVGPSCFEVFLFLWSFPRISSDAIFLCSDRGSAVHELDLHLHDQIKSCSWSSVDAFLVMGYVGCLFGIYSIVPQILISSGATFLNLSLLTSDFWAVLFGVTVSLTVWSCVCAGSAWGSISCGHWRTTWLENTVLLLLLSLGTLL